MKEILKAQSERNYLLFQLGINTGFRISDILTFKAKDLRNKTHFNIKTKKTGKTHKLKIQSDLKKNIDNYIKKLKDHEYLFQSQKGHNQPIKRQHVWKILNSAAKQVGLEEIGTHTLRKSFGYWAFKQTNDITVVQQLLGHSSPQITLRYIGILQDDLDKVIDNLKIG